ncbi:hypothetical protein BGZ59_001288 [Podila verticillata]|nr:hypothetical protein BGZ59_001288 [Podila verticillata]
MAHAYFNPDQTALFGEMVARKDTTFEVEYYGLHGLASPVRTILAACGAAFTSVVPEDWASAKAKSPFGLFNESIKHWLEFHEKYLRDNGSNGHYVGSTMSIADVLTVNLINIVVGIYGGDVVTEAKTPALWKVKTTLEAIPSYAAWTQTESFKAISARNKEVLGF